MRSTFAKKVYEAAKRDKRIILVTVDFGYGTFDKLKADCPDQYINVGIAEQLAVDFAVGAAEAGCIPIIYGIAAFLPSRAYEQIRVGAAYRNLPILIVGGGGGYTMAVDGVSHHAPDDIALMSLIPDMDIFAPYDCDSVEKLFDSWIGHPRTAYMRLTANGENKKLDFDDSCKDSFINDGIIEIPAKEIAIIGMGNILSEAVAAREILKANKITIDVIPITSFDDAAIEKALNGYDTVFVVEEISRHCGLYSRCCEIVNDFSINTVLIRIDNDNKFRLGNFDLPTMRKQNKCDALSIVEIVRKAC